MRRYYIRLFLSFSAGIGGFTLICFHANVWVALGVFLCLFGNNVDRSVK